MTKISIITINYNNRSGLEETILSVINQSFENFEYIVVDGSSTDGSVDIIKSYEEFINVVIVEPDTGIYNAMNKGVKLANGEYLLFLNSGDILVNDSGILQKIEDKLNSDIVAFDCLLENNGEIVGKRTHISRPTLFYVYKNGFKHQSTFICKRLFDRIGLYNENYKIAGDYDFWIRSLLNPQTSVVGYDITLAIFRLGGISQNSNLPWEHPEIHKNHLNNILSDFEEYESLLNYKQSRFLKPFVWILNQYNKF